MTQKKRYRGEESGIQPLSGQQNQRVNQDLMGLLGDREQPH